MPWRQIGGPAGRVYAGGAGVIATNPQSGDLFSFSGTDWLPVGAASDIYVSDDKIFSLSPPIRNELVPIMILDPKTGQLTAFQPAASAYWMYVGGGYYFTLLANDGVMGDIYGFQLSLNTGATWQHIGGPGKSFVVAGPSLFGVSPNGQQILAYYPDQQGWTVIGGPTDGVLGGSNGLVSRGTDGNLYYYKFDYQWTLIGPAPSSYAAVNDTGVFTCSIPTGDVFQSGPFPGIWSKIGSSFLNIFGYPSKRPSFTDYPCLFALSNPDSNLWLWELKASISCSYNPYTDVGAVLAVSGTGFTVSGQVEIYSYGSSPQPILQRSLVSNDGSFTWEGTYNSSQGLSFYAIDVATGDVTSGVTV